MSDWHLLTVSSSVLLPDRWKMFWQYVLLGRKPIFTLSAWVTGDQKAMNIKIGVSYDKHPRETRSFDGLLTITEK